MSSQRSLRPRRSVSESPRSTRQSVRLHSEPLTGPASPPVKNRARRQLDSKVQLVPAATERVIKLKSQKLATVDEDDSSDEVETAKLQLENDNNRLRSASVGSAPSGASTAQIEDLQGKAQQLLKLLPRLASSSLSIITAIRSELVSEAASADLLEEVTSRESGLHSMFKVFHDTYDFYPALGHHWSSASHILEALTPAWPAEERDGALEKQLTHLINMANLAKLMHEVLFLGQNGDKSTVLQTVESIFPQPFLPSLSRTDQNSVHETSQLVEETLDAMVSIRTQIVMEILKSQVTVVKDPDLVLQENLLKAWNITNFQNVERQDVDDFLNKTIARAESIRECRKEDHESIVDDDLIDLDLLDSKFPWASFVHDIGNWIGLRAREIEVHCNTIGGITEIARELQSQIRRGPTKNVTDQVEEEQHFNSLTLPMKTQQAIMKGLRPRLGNGKLQRPSRIVFPQPSNKQKRPLDENSAALPTTMILEERPITERVGKAAKPKAKSFMNRQPNASKVVFESQDDNQPVRSSVLAARNSSQSDDFQQDDRQTNAVARRAAAMEVQKASAKKNREPPSAQSAQSPPKRPRLQALEDEASNATTAIVGNNNIAEAENSASEDERATLSLRVMSQATRENQEKKREQTEILRTEKRQRRGKRLAWTDSENNALLQAIARHGCRWSRIKDFDDNSGGLLDARDQGDLKDRARNIKYDLLRHGVQNLPENLESVRLPKSQIERLRDVGIIDPLERILLNGNDALQDD